MCLLTELLTQNLLKYWENSKPFTLFYLEKNL